MSYGPTRVDECLQHLQSRVTPAMNVQLLRQFTEEEVNAALAQMHPLKSPDPTVTRQFCTKKLGEQ